MTASLTLVVLMAVLFGAGISIMLERSLTRVLIGFLLVGNAVNILIYLDERRRASRRSSPRASTPTRSPTRSRRRSSSPRS